MLKVLKNYFIIKYYNMTLINVNYLIGVIESNATEIPLTNPLHSSLQNCSDGCDLEGMNS